jgi:hypothetical protein
VLVLDRIGKAPLYASTDTYYCVPGPARRLRRRHG